MRIPIQYALTWPARKDNSLEKLDFTKLAGLEFFEPEWEKFPALSLAFEAGRTGKSATAVLNAANEIAVAAFLENRLSFLGIPKLVEDVLNHHNLVDIESFEQLLEIDQWARLQAESLIKEYHQ